MLMEKNNRKLLLGVEIGGTKQQMAVCDEQGAIMEMVSKRVVLKRGAQDILDWISETVPLLLEKYPSIDRIGVGFGGPLETATGRVLISLHVPGWKDFELKTWFEESFHIPTIVVNDTVAGGYAEYKLGSGKDSGKFFYSNIGTGIGGSFFVGDYTWDGIGYGASYFGNTYVSDWTSEEKGAVDRIEALCSGTSIERRLRTPGYIPESSLLCKMCEGDVTRANCAMLGKAAEQGDDFALKELERIGYSYGIGVANVVTLLGIDTFSIGGGVANLGKWILEPIRKAAEKYVFISGKDRFKVVICELLDDNVPVGAALYARDGFQTI